MSLPRPLKFENFKEYLSQVHKTRNNAQKEIDAIKQDLKVQQRILDSMNEFEHLVNLIYTKIFEALKLNRNFVAFEYSVTKKTELSKDEYLALKDTYGNIYDCLEILGVSNPTVLTRNEYLERSITDRNLKTLIDQLEPSSDTLIIFSIFNS